jgi:polyribonucleotide nucleotidyltransferase
LHTTVELPIGEKILRLESGRLARQAAGEVLVSYGETMVLVCVTFAPEASEDTDFLPMTVEYREMFFAAGKIPGGFIKRERGLSEKEVLSSRQIDRPIRPLFPPNFRNEVQIIASVLSSDTEHEADTLGIIGASAALIISDLPYNTPIAGIRVGLKDGQYIINPSLSQQEGCKLVLVVVGTKESVVMIEGGANEATEDEVAAAIRAAQPEINKIIGMQEAIREKVGKAKIEPPPPYVDDALAAEIKAALAPDIPQVFQFTEKQAREEAHHQLIKNLAEKMADKGEAIEKKINWVADQMIQQRMREKVLTEKKRIDGRGLDEIRNLSCEIGVLPRTHGSAIFTRGQTQSLAVTTLGTASDEQRIDAIYGEESKSFMLHYSFPPYSVGEVRPLRGPSRREIGHGALAERAIQAVLPKDESFPYTIRIVSTILESNGSSSMASVCSSSLSLMDAGVKIKAAVAGISIGLVKENDRYALLTDIIGDEDHYGDMDFKVAGTTEGITAIQLDLKIGGVSVDLLTDAMAKAKQARLDILKTMNATINTPRSEISKYAPKIIAFFINKAKIGEVIGPGGKVIRKISEEWDVQIDIDDDGKVAVSGVDSYKVEQAQNTILGIVAEAEVGKTYKGKVTRLMNFGAFVEILPGKEGLIHISKLSRQRVRRVEDVVKVGDELMVKVFEIDEKGRINLIRKE